MTTPPEEPRRSAPRFIVPVPVGSVAARGDEAHAPPAVAEARQGRSGPPRVTRLDRPDPVAFAVLLLWASFALSVGAAIGVLVALAAAVTLAQSTGAASIEPDAVAMTVVAATAIVLVVQLVLTVLVARGSDGARAGLAIVAVLVGVLALVGGGGAGLGAVVLVVAVAALFVPSSNAWFREVRGHGAAR
ncbi:hypothetical protein [Agrococcus sp. SGAir0287]|uniref:hypothetical protein n=1 Tax=Agrococcus sp. SGAir0287 TaxID=2070347 RepID=UPI0010CCFF2E|nr:hypothetical protein [Agrococcus sp. SGAir0287]QCR20183.1 hypothetical protein C1N71_12650 [Agrococcus sp. SGAir0287]